MTTLIIYNSQHGTTKNYAFEIQKFLAEKNIVSKISSTDDYSEEDVEKADNLLLGCWTSGLFFFAQHPDRKWKKFATSLPDLKNKKVGFFTTYKLATGSMFRKMHQRIADKANPVDLNLKSKSDKLTEENKQELEGFLNS